MNREVRIKKPSLTFNLGYQWLKCDFRTTTNGRAGGLPARTGSLSGNPSKQQPRSTLLDSSLASEPPIITAMTYRSALAANAEGTTIFYMLPKIKLQKIVPISVYMGLFKQRYKITLNLNRGVPQELEQFTSSELPSSVGTVTCLEVPALLNLPKWFRAFRLS
ncbi:hypothetical protein J6590_100999 [Homalodisca vitripennis]|nr:hypothetical protein J6590_100999 [Homalodisca vitripennis]